MNTYQDYGDATRDYVLSLLREAGLPLDTEVSVESDSDSIAFYYYYSPDPDLYEFEWELLHILDADSNWFTPILEEVDPECAKELHEYEVWRYRHPLSRPSDYWNA